MFTDPIGITYNAVSKVLPRIGNDEDSSEYQLRDGDVVYNLVLSHTFAKRNRVVARLRRDALADDPMELGGKLHGSQTVSFTMDFPTTGVAPADVLSLAKALLGMLVDANITKLVNGET